MGIKYLNKYLRTNCPESIQCISVADLSGKKIVVDISIYLYKYETEGGLLENMYLLLSILRHYNVIPIFIFDGKSPAEKKALIQKRAEDRNDAVKEYKELQYKLQDIETEDEKQDIVEAMDQLKKKIVYITKEKIEKVKDLIRSYGMTYYDAPGEADELCAMLVIKKKVWACLSEDMDMFVYGCTRVIRYFSLMNHSAVLYSTPGILEELKMTQDEFRDVCIVSGTDYNMKVDYASSKINIFTTMKYFQKYKDSNNNGSNDFDFYRWLQENTNYIDDLELLQKITQMFQLNCNKEVLEIYNNISIVNTVININNMKNILRDDGFIFVC